MSNKKETVSTPSDFKQALNGFSQLWNSETLRWENEMSAVGIKGIERLEEATEDTHRLLRGQLDLAKDSALLTSKLMRAFSSHLFTAIS